MNASNIQGKIITGGQMLTASGVFLYDKIINAKFTRQDGTSFTVRSDYEMVKTPVGFYFRKCAQKPALKVEYKQVAGDVTINIKLTVVNLHLLSENNEHVIKKESAHNNPIEHITIQIGYFNQFPVFTSSSSRLTKEDFFDLEPRLKTDSYLTLECSVLAVYPDKLPPDGETVFDCVVGNITDRYHGVRDEKTDTDILPDTGKTLEDFLWKNIQKCYLRDFRDLNKIRVDSKTAGSVKGVGEDGLDVDLTYFGEMDDASARNYGVKCFITSGAKAVKYDTGLSMIPRASTVQQAIESFLRMYTKYRAVPMPDGNYVIYSVGESYMDISSELKKEGIVKDVETLPAVTSITYSGIRTIKCLFTPQLKPFQEFNFTSRYNLGNLISNFYSPEQGMEKFTAIMFKVNFSTTGDENEVEIMSTDSLSVGG